MLSGVIGCPRLHNLTGISRSLSSAVMFNSVTVICSGQRLSPPF
jgi:hypothetical protein